MTAIPIQSSARWRRDGQLLRDAKSMGTEHLAELSTKLSGLRCSEPDTTTFYGCFMRYIGNLSEAQQYAAVANLRLVTAAYISELCGVFPVIRGRWLRSAVDTWLEKQGTSKRPLHQGAGSASADIHATD